MNKSEIVDIIAEGTGLTKVETMAVVDGIFATITYALRKGQRVDIRGFGSFKVADRKARNTRSPATGEMIHVPARKAPVFRASKDLRRLVAEGLEEPTDITS